MNTIIDFKEEYNRQLRAKRTRLFVARCSVFAAVVLLVLCVIAVMTTVCNPLFTVLAITILIAGFWGDHYLSTRH